MDPPPRLACQQCKSRKIKCDKGAPCSACRSASLSCHAVQRARLPRGKTAKTRSQNKGLEARVARIENLLEQQAATSRVPYNVPNTSGADIVSSKGIEANKASPKSMSDLVAPDFWSALSDEVHGLREALADDDDEIQDGAKEAEPLGESMSDAFGTRAMFFARSTNGGYTNVRPPSPVRAVLLNLYKERVDSVYKICHWPTVLTMIETNHARAQDGPLSVSEQSLEYAIYFMSLCSVSDTEAEEMGLDVRINMLQRYRASVESLFAQSNLLQNPDLIVLQAFVIYLVSPKLRNLSVSLMNAFDKLLQVGLRTCLSGAYTWTLIAVAVRAATALRLGDESTQYLSPFEVQLRRRLFFAIGILDTHSALDRGTIPILPSVAFQAPPLNISDNEMSSPNNVPVASSPGPTDMSHTVMIYEAMICQRSLYEMSNGTESGWGQWSNKMKLLADFERSMMSGHAHSNSSSEPLRLLQKISAQKIVVSMQLLARRPPYRQPRDVVPPWDDFDIMKAATGVLEQHLQPVPIELRPWAWKSWVQWHALAVVLAELMVRPRGAFSERAYSIATRSFHHYAKLVADSETGLLWKPIAKLMRRVQQMRQVPHPEATQTELNCAGSTDGSLTPAEQIHFMAQEADQSFDVSNWEMNIDPLDTIFFDTGDISQPYNPIESANDTPWLSWDTFVQDLNYPST